MALESMRRAYARDPVRELIEAREKAERDELNRLHTARQQGRQEGETRGRAEGKLEVARGLIAAGVELKTIKRATGLTSEQLNSLITES